MFLSLLHTQQRVLFMLVKHCGCCADGSGEAAGGGAVAGRKAVDFESLAFAQGNHLMTNKKCDLPQKSYRAAHKVSDTALAAIPICAAHEHSLSLQFTLSCLFQHDLHKTQLWIEPPDVSIV